MECVVLLLMPGDYPLGNTSFQETVESFKVFIKAEVREQMGKK